jgi:hypothetical protein
MHGPNAKPQTKRCAVGAGYEAGGRQGAEQPTLTGPPAPRPTTSPLTWWAAALRPSSPLHAADLRHRSGVRMRCKVAGLRPGNVAERPQAERAGGGQAANVLQPDSISRHQTTKTPSSEVLSQRYCWSPN